MKHSKIALAVALCLSAVSSLAAANRSPSASATMTVTAESAAGPVQEYVATRTATGSKTDTPILEIPQSVSVVTSKEMTVQGTTSLLSALRYTSGVNSNDSANTTFESFTLRGFPVSSSGLLKDRIRLGNQSAGFPVEPYGLERVEVLKGPSAGLYGNSGAGGVINLITKRPTASPLHETGITYGSYDRLQLASDHSGSLNDSDTLLYRLTVLGRKSGAFFDYGKDNRIFVAPALTWRPSDHTRLTLLTSYQKTAVSSYSGGSLPDDPLGTPRNRYLGEPDLAYWSTTNLTAGYIFEHYFSDTWKLTQNLRYARSLLDSRNLYPVAPVGDGININRQAILADMDNHVLTLDNNLQVNWYAMGAEHTTLAGLDYTHMTRLDDRWTGQSTKDTRLNVYHPIYGKSPLDAPTHVVTPLRYQQLGLYLQQQSRFANHWVATLGGRYDWVENYIGIPASLQTASHYFFHKSIPEIQRDRAFSGRLGLNYLFDNGLAPYISYTTSYEPQLAITSEFTPLKPSTGRQYEVGMKYQPVDTNALFTLALYELYEQNISAPDATSQYFSIQIGEIRARGLELEGKADIASGTRIRGSVTVTDAVITKNNDPHKVGLKMPDMPERMASLWIDQRLPQHFLANLTVGLGVRYVSGLWDDDNKYKTTGRTLVDAMASYQFDKLNLTLHINNLFDKKYNTSCRGICEYGDPRTIMLTANYAW